MSTNPQFADTQPPTDFKADLVEEGRKLLELQEANRITRQSLLNAHVYQKWRTKGQGMELIKDTSIGK